MPYYSSRERVAVGVGITVTVAVGVFVGRSVTVIVELVLNGREAVGFGEGWQLKINRAINTGRKKKTLRFLGPPPGAAFCRIPISLGLFRKPLGLF